MNPKIATRRATLLLLLFTLCASAVVAQTSVFTYQGRLTDGGTAANGNYDLQFALFDSLAGGTQIGATQTSPNVLVSAGIFSVQLDFGASAFPGANRFLEIGARLTGAASFTTLAPRQPITSTPYAIRSSSAANADTAANANNATNATNAVNATTATTATNATQLGGVAANQYVQTNGNGSGLTNLNATSITTGTLNNARLGLIPTANIADNAVTAPKIASGQVVKGVTVGATTLTDNVTLAAGANITITPAGNTLTIASTGGTGGGGGTTNTIPLWTAGTTLGNSVITQSGGNVGIGLSSPISKLDVSGQGRFVGVDSRVSDGYGVYGESLGVLNHGVFGVGGNGADGLYGVSIGGRGVYGEGSTGVEGFSTSGIAVKASGSFLGTGGATITGTNGDGAVVTARRSGGDAFVIIDSTTVSQSSVLAFRKNNLNRWLAFADSISEGGDADGSNFRLDAYNDAGGGIATRLFVRRNPGQVGIDTNSPTQTLDVNGRARVRSIPTGSNPIPLCFNAAGDLLNCNGSSLRFKNNVHDYSDGLNILRQLRPISYNWKEGGAYDIGLGAEDVAKVAPFFAFRNKEGVVEGVRYERLNMVLINAVKQQQDQIEILRTENTALNARLRSVERSMERIVRKMDRSRRRHR